MKCAVQKDDDDGNNLFYAVEKPTPGRMSFSLQAAVLGPTMNAATMFRYELTNLCEAACALNSGTARYFHTGTPSDRPEPEHKVSKPSTPQFYELLIPIFRFFLYPGGKAVITPTAVAAAIRAMREEGLESDWQRYLEGRSPVVFQTKRTGYLDRRQPESVVRCAELLHERIGVTRNAPLEKTVSQPHRQVWRVYANELAPEHATSLATAAEIGGTVKFRGQKHLVKPCQGAWTTAAGTPTAAFDLLKTK